MRDCKPCNGSAAHNPIQEQRQVVDPTSGWMAMIKDQVCLVAEGDRRRVHSLIAASSMYYWGLGTQTLSVSLTAATAVTP